MDVRVSHKPRCIAAMGTCKLRCRGTEGGVASCRLSETVHIRTYRRGQYLFHEGDDCAQAHVLISGLLALERIDGGGRVTIISLLHAGRTFGLADLFHSGTHSTSARALHDSVLCRLPRSMLVQAVDTDSSFALALLEWAGEETREIERSAYRYAAMSVEERIISLLVELSGGLNSFDLTLTKTDIARMAATSPESLSRVLGRLRRSGRIDVSDARVAFTAGVHKVMLSILKDFELGR